MEVSRLIFCILILAWNYLSYKQNNVPYLGGNSYYSCMCNRLHLNSWRCSGHSSRTNREQHWGIRRTPKTELIKELKLTGTDEYRDEESITEKLADGLGETNSNYKDCHTNIDDSLSKNPNRRRMKQLLQFDKSPRPAFYGTWPKERCVQFAESVCYFQNICKLY